MPVKKAELQELALVRLREAEALLASNLPSGAFHLGGLALELALKACIATLFDRHVIPDKRFVTDIYSHDLRGLIKTAGLLPNLTQASKDVQQNWEIVKDWTVDSRYNLVADKEAQEMIAAIADR